VHYVFDVMDGYVRFRLLGRLISDLFRARRRVCHAFRLVVDSTAEDTITKT